MKTPILACLLLAAPSDAAPWRQVELDGLLANPPFLAAGSPAADGPEHPGGPEFRGVVLEDGTAYFSLFDPAGRRAEWLRIDERGAAGIVRAYDAGRDLLVVERDGRRVELPLKRAPVQALAAAPPPASPPPLPPAGAGREGASRPTPAAAPTVEAQRLQQIAEEIRRRRGVRQASPATSDVP